MKKNTIFLFIAFLALFWQGNAQFVDENFDSGIPATWSVVDNTGNGGWQGVTDRNGNDLDGTPFAIIDSDGAGSVDLDTELISPEVDVTSVTELLLTFDHYFNAYSGNEKGDVDVYDGTQWVNVYTTSADVGAWSNPDHQEIDVSQYINANFKVRFHYYDANWDWYWAVDNVKIDVPPSCQDATDLAVNNVGETTADVSWTDNNSGNSTYTVEWREAGSSGAWNSDTTAQGATSYQITGLTSNTQYEWQVTADCGPDGTSQTVAGPNFRTECSILPTPFSETFEDTSNSLSCWKNETATDQLDWYWNSGSTASSGTGPDSAYEGNYYVYVETSGSNNSDTAVMYSPRLDLSGLTTPRLNFRYHMYGAGMDPDGSIDVDISTDGGQTYTNIFHQEGDHGNQWNQGIVDLSSYSGTVQFRITGTVSSSGTEYQNDFAIDLFNVEETPACPEPTDLAVSNVTDTQADLSWTAGGNETQWNIEWGVTGFTQGQGTMINGTTDNPYTLTGLTTQTTYDYYVQADCGGGDTSNWVGPYTFTTTPVNNLPSGAIDLSVGGSCNFATYSNAGATDSNEGAPGCGNYQGADVWFKFTAPSNAIRIDTNTGDITDGAMAVYSGTPGNLTLIECDDDDSANGLMPMIERTDYVAGNTYYVRFWEYGGNVFGTFDICVSTYCPDPTNLNVTDLTDNSATLNWTDNTGGNATYTVEWRELGATTWNSDSTAAGATSYALTGLNQQTEYEWQVTTNCSANQSSYTIAGTNFTTPCTPITPDYTQDFTNYVPDCWQEAEGPDSGPTSYGSSGWAADGWLNNGSTGAVKFNLYNANDQDWLLSPKFDLGLGEYQLEFDVAVVAWGTQNPSAMGSDDQVKLMMSTDGGNTWTTLQEWNANNVPSATGDHIVIDLSAYTQPNVQFGFWANEGTTNDSEDYDFMIDNFKVIYPPCQGQPIVPDYTQNFNHFTPSCWSEAFGTPGNLSYANTHWTNDGFLNNGTTGAARIYIHGNQLNEWLVSPSFDLTSGGYELSFAVGVTSFSNGGGVAMGMDDFVKLMVSTDGGMTWTEKEVWNHNNSPGNTGEYEVIDLSPYANSSSVKFAFYASSGDTSNAGYNFYVDYFNITTNACQAPSNLNTVITGPTSATLEWTDNSGGSSTYLVEWRDIDGGMWNSSTTAAGASSYNLTGLMENHTYEWKVTADCGNSSSSTVSGNNFTPTCVPIIPDYLENFDVFLSDCWSEGKGNMNSYSFGNSYWTNDGFLNNGTTGAARIRLYTNSYDSWLISPVFDLSGGNYELQMNVGITKFSGSQPSPMGSDDIVAVKITTDGGATWTDLQTWTANNAPSNTGDFVQINLSSYNSSSVQFAIVASDGSVADLAYNFYVDNFSIVSSTQRPNPEVKTDTLVKVSVTENDRYFTIKTDNGTPIENITVYDMSGKIIYNETNLTEGLKTVYLNVPSGNLLVFVVKTTKNNIPDIIKVLKK